MACLSWYCHDCNNYWMNNKAESTCPVCWSKWITREWDEQHTYNETYIEEVES